MPNRNIVIDGVYKRNDFEELVKVVCSAYYYSDTEGGDAVVYSIVKSDRNDPQELFATLEDEFLRDYTYTGVNFLF